MTVDMILPTSKDHWLDLRAQDVTSTEIAALFNCSPYMTAYELWHRKRDSKIISISENERMTWGLRLQDAIAAGIAKDEGWKIKRVEEYARIADLRLGASFDFFIEPDAILEVKNVDGLIFHNNWVEDGDDIEAPAHIELQLQHQLLVSGRKRGYIAALVGGNRVVLIEREADAEIASSIKRVAAAFWDSVDVGTEPVIDFGSDADFISQLYNHAEPGKIIDASDGVTELALKDKGLAAQEKALEAERSEIKAKILVEIGDAEKVKGETFTISAGEVGPTEVSYSRKGYRSFKITHKKQKKEAK